MESITACLHADKNNQLKERRIISGVGGQMVPCKRKRVWNPGQGAGGDLY
jgi:hypothetical protein